MSLIGKVPAFLRFHGVYESPPSDQFTAALVFALLSPCPAEVWDHLPLSFYWKEDFPSLQAPPILSLLYAEDPGQVSASAKALEALFGRLLTYPDAVSVLKTAIKPVSGRAGGKVNLTLSQALTSGVLDQWGVLMARCLGTMSQLGKLSPHLEETQVMALVLLSSFSDYSWLATRAILCQPAILSEPLPNIAKFLKNLHKGVRMTRSLPGMLAPAGDDFVRKLYGLDTILGRSEHLGLDVHSEILMRLRDPTRRSTPEIRSGALTWSSHDQYLSDLSSAISQAVEETHPSPYSGDFLPETFSEWYSKRMGWAAAGGAPGAKLKWGLDSSPERLNKRGALLIIPDSHYKTILERACPPILWSKCAPKYENGKMRAIWNTSVEYYVIQAYLCDVLERTQTEANWDSAHHSIAQKLSADISRLTSLTGDTGLMWDYSDFNINHTFSAMAILHSKFADKVSSIVKSKSSLYLDGATPSQAIHDIQLVVTWLNAAHSQTYLEDDKGDFVARVVRSLQSGERATSLVNTYLNRAYTILADRWCQKYLGRTLHSGLFYLQGDDAFFTTRNPYEGALLATVFNLLGFAGQLSKITNNYTGSGEFLRNSISGSDFVVGGYPIRSAMGLINGEFFREYSGDPTSRVAAFIDQYAKVRRRGSTISSRLLPILMSNIASLVYTDESGNKHRVIIPPQLITLPARFGGYGIGYTQQNFTGVVNLLGDPSTMDSPRPASSFHLSKTLTCAAIPVGEGKTTLATKYPAIFYDHDQLYHRPGFSRGHYLSIVTRAHTSGQYDELNAFHRQQVSDNVDLIAGRCLLTWSRHTVPYDCTFLGSFLLGEDTQAKELTTSNRTSLISDNRYSFSGSYRSRDHKLMNAYSRSFIQAIHARLATGNSLVCPPAFPVARGPKPPIFSLKRIPTSSFISRAANKRFAKPQRDISDLSAPLLLSGRPRFESVKKAIVKSALAGAFEASDLSSSLAEFAKLMEQHVRRTTISKEVEITVAPAHCQSLFFTFFKASLAALANSNSNTKAPTNNYSIIQSWAVSSGFSLLEVYRMVIDSLEPSHIPGLPGKLFSAIKHLPPTEQKKALSVPIIRDLIAADSPQRRQLIAKYVLGELDLIPPPYSLFSSTLTSWCRSISLSFVEQHPSHFSYSYEYLVDSIYTYDVIAISTVPVLLANEFRRPIHLSD
jgi:hypothetical protein